MKKNNGKKLLSDIKLYSDYLKWKDDLDRYETWEEACEDIINGHRQKYAGIDIEEELTSALESMKEMKVFASQRNLQFRYPQVKRSNLRLYNCSVLHAVNNNVFQNTCYLLINGCGVGVSLLKPFVDNISSIKDRENGTKTFVIEDNMEGWADAFGVLISSYLVDNQPFPEYSNCKIRFDYSLIRPEGSLISGGFKAPGPNSLKNSLEKVETFLDNLIDKKINKLRPIHVFDIICHISDCILSGGVRRSALNMIVDPNDTEMIYAKTGNWRQSNPQRARSNNSVLLLRNLVSKEQFEEIVKLNDGDNDIGFVFANSWFDMFNPCYEISFTPILTDKDLTQITYEELPSFIKDNKDMFGQQLCNLTSMNAEKIKNKEDFLRACKDEAILGTLQAGYTDFPYFKDKTEELTEKEALLGTSITGWMNNSKILNADWLQEGVKIILETNEKLATKLGINKAARTTCVKPEGNLSVIAQTSSGFHPEHSERYFRIMQINKNSDVAKYLIENCPFLLEESVWSANNTDYVIFVPVINPSDAIFKDSMKGIKHLEAIKFAQQNWVIPGTRKECGISPKINHNISATVILDHKESVINYIWDNKDSFTAVSFISDYGDKDFNQAPFTSVLNVEEIFRKYGKGALFISGLIVDGLHYFNNNLWEACDYLDNQTLQIVGTKEQVMLRKYWISRAKKFAKNYFKNDIKTLIYCLKDIHLCHKWESITRELKEIDFTKILTKPNYKDVSDYAAIACSGKDGCSVTKI